MGKEYAKSTLSSWDTNKIAPLPCSMAENINEMDNMTKGGGGCKTTTYTIGSFGNPSRIIPTDYEHLQQPKEEGLSLPK
ncbi:hypothetical protein V6N11_068137 [Hibiscus sabdariffa]|uniref:Uncharacterized protein n=1 Tax=Hibiscus sabdariffa TaxID=183260 RepID=A0ABR2SSU7_9ROSI